MSGTNSPAAPSDVNPVSMPGPIQGSRIRHAMAMKKRMLTPANRSNDPATVSSRFQMDRRTTAFRGPAIFAIGRRAARCEYGRRSKTKRGLRDDAVPPATGHRFELPLVLTSFTGRTVGTGELS